MPDAPTIDTHPESGPRAPEDLIEAYLDGELGELDARRVERRAKADPDFAAELDLARRIQTGLRSMQLTCPPEVTSAAFAETGQRSSFFSGFSGWHGVAALAAAALLAVLVFLPAPLDRTDEHPQPAEPMRRAEVAPPLAASPSPAEVEAARKEVELAFAYLGRLGRTAEDSVRRLATDSSAAPAVVEAGSLDRERRPDAS